MKRFEKVSIPSKRGIGSDIAGVRDSDGDASLNPLEAGHRFRPEIDGYLGGRYVSIPSKRGIGSDRIGFTLFWELSLSQSPRSGA